jgi:hypothetical protein
MSVERASCPPEEGKAPREPSVQLRVRGYIERLRDAGRGSPGRLSIVRISPSTWRVRHPFEQAERSISLPQRSRHPGLHPLAILNIPLAN